LEEWKSKIAVDSYAPAMLAKSMAKSLLNNMHHRVGEHHNTDTYEPSIGVCDYIIGLAEDLQVILR
jgi:hypothetical protein